MTRNSEAAMTGAHYRMAFLALLIMVSACAEAGDPVESPVPEPELRYTITVKADSLEAVGSCESIVSIDETIGGPIDGDFGYSFKIFWPDGTVTALASSSGYPNPNVMWHAVKGQKHRWGTTLIAVRTVTGRNLPPTMVELRATEFDWDVFARSWKADIGMNDLRATRAYGANEGAVSFLTAQGDADKGEGALVEGCALRIHYTFRAFLVR